MTNKNYIAGSSRERSLIHIAMANGAQLAVKGAGSKSYSADRHLKIDMIILKKPYVYLIQSKKGKSTKKQRLGFSISAGGLEDWWFVRAAYIESLDQAKELFER